MRPEWVARRTPWPDLEAWPLTGIKRLDQKISIDDAGCWHWTGKRDHDGYGKAYIGARWHFAHRVVYELRVQPIPEGLTIDHLCRVRDCVNPGHLEPVTVRENTLRGLGPSAMNARKVVCKEGHEIDGIDHLGKRFCKTCAAIRGSEWGIRKRNAQPCGAPSDSGQCKRTIAVGKVCPYHYRINIDGRVFDIQTKRTAA